MTIDGRAIAAEILAEVKGQQAEPAAVRAITIAPTPVTLSYLKIKEKAAVAAGMELTVVQLPADAEIDRVIEAIQAPGADAVVIQLPLPEELDEDYILARIPKDKDADVLSPYAREEGALIEPVADAVREILQRAGVDPAGKNAVVVGEGRLVGGPVAAWLKSAGADVLTLNYQTFNLPESKAALRAADIVVSGAGVPHLIVPEMIKEGVVLIDAGTAEKGGALAGDVDPDCEPKASVFTPVPGGVGPVSVACLFRNVAQLRKTHLGVL